jgi:hypothetical protein
MDSDHWMSGIDTLESLAWLLPDRQHRRIDGSISHGKGKSEKCLCQRMYVPPRNDIRGQHPSLPQRRTIIEVE